jgi:hypothetical protein
MFPTPAAAALAEWENVPNAHVQVIAVELRDADHAVVVTDTDPPHVVRLYCERNEYGWVCTGDLD